MQGKERPDNLSESNIKRFNEVARSWDDEPRRVQLANAVAQAIKNQIPLSGKMTALEFGCGTGLVTMAIAPHVKSLTAVDTSQEMLAVLQQKIETARTRNVIPLKRDVLTQGLPEGGFDFIYSSMTLHHIEDVPALIQVFAAHLNRGGYLAIADLAQEDGSFHDENTGVAHHGFDFTEMEQLCASVGLTRPKTTIAFSITKERDGEAREYPVMLLTVQKT